MSAQERSGALAGYTLVEVIAVVTVLSIIGLITSGVVTASMTVYGRVTSMADATTVLRTASVPSTGRCCSHAMARTPW